jgi:epoxyqueuosine reductase
MDYLAQQVEHRINPARELPGVRSIIMVADRYAARGDAPPTAQPAPGATALTSQTPLRGRIARYAQGRDYHQVIKRRLHKLADALRTSFPQSTFRAFTDTAPVLEREHAARAALGWVGKHTLIIHPRGGSYTLLGGVLTDLDLPAPPEQTSVADSCGTCTRCIEACPTGAITPYSVDARRCVSYLTLEHQGPIDPSLQAGVGDWIAGCDICQEVCPHNSPRPFTATLPQIKPAYSPRLTSLDLLEVLGWTAPDRARVLGVSALKRPTLAMLKRNALVVLGNLASSAPHGPPPHALERLRACANDPREDPLVRTTAAQVLARLAEYGPRPKP